MTEAWMEDFDRAVEDARNPPPVAPVLRRERSRSESPPRKVSGLGRPEAKEDADWRPKPKAAKRSERVQVFTRFRPENAKEKKKGGTNAVTYGADGRSVALTLGGVSHNFRFARAFAPEVPQEEVYHYVARPIVDAVMGGINAAVIAYGQTGSGKTYTMMGAEGAKTGEFDVYGAKRGLTPRIVSTLFETMAFAPEDMIYEIRVSYVEVYLEKCYDLLSPVRRKDFRDRTALKLRRYYTGKAYEIMTDATEVPVDTFEDVLMVMERGAKARETAATGANLVSSRSHAIFQMTIISTDTLKGITRTAKLNLVDLAGSEKASKTGLFDEKTYEDVLKAAKKSGVSPAQQMEIRKREAATINTSLLALGNVIVALTGKKRAAHIPYRDSTLTQLLYNTFGGNAVTSLIVNASPSTFNGEESLSTLRFGDRASGITNKVAVNQVRSEAELRRLLAEASLRVGEQAREIQDLDAVLNRYREIAEEMLCRLQLQDSGESTLKALRRRFPVLRDLTPMTVQMYKYIPAYLVGEIFTYLDGVSLARCAIVCKSWKVVTDNDVFWKMLLHKLFPKVHDEVPSDKKYKDAYVKHAAKEALEKIQAAKDRIAAERAKILGGGGGIRLLPN